MLHTRSHPLSANVVRSGLAYVVSIGSGLFVLLYVVAAWYYPGGSNADSSATGFNLSTNYWCDLLGRYAKNGQLNPGQPFAMVAMLMLCLTLGYFGYVTPSVFDYSKRLRSVLQTAGVGSMAIAPFIFTSYHDAVINLAGIMGIISMLGTIIGLYKRRYISLFLFGLVCIAVCGLNNYIYYTQHFIKQLPIIQKISFLLILFWFNLVSVVLCRKTPLYE